MTKRKRNRLEDSVFLTSSISDALTFMPPAPGGAPISRSKSSVDESFRSGAKDPLCGDCVTGISFPSLSNLTDFQLLQQLLSFTHYYFFLLFLITKNNVFVSRQQCPVFFVSMSRHKNQNKNKKHTYLRRN